MKKEYIKPNIDAVVLDKEISLQLASPNNNPTIDTGLEKPLSAPSSARQSDPYQYEDW